MKKGTKKNKKDDIALLEREIEKSVLRSKLNELEDTDKDDKKLGFWRKLGKRSNMDSAAALRIGVIHGFLGNYPRAITVFDDLYALSFDSGFDELDMKALAWKAKALFMMNHYEESIDTYEKLRKDKTVELQSDDWFFIAANYYYLDNFSESIKAANKGLRAVKKEKKDKDDNELFSYHEYFSPEDMEMHLYSGLSASYAQLETNDELQNAKNFAIKALKINIERMQSWHSLITAYGKLGDHKTAIELSRLALQIDPENANILHERGLNFMDLKKYEDAEINFRAMIEIDSGDERAWFNLGCVYSVMNRKHQAIDALITAKNLGSEDYLSMKDEVMLKNIWDDIEKYKKEVESGASPYVPD